MILTNTSHLRRAATGLSRIAPVLALSTVTSGCFYQEYSGTNPNHCANQDGDVWCAERHGEERPYCILGNGICGPTEDQDGCVPELPADACYSPCGQSMTIEDDASCLGVGDSSDGTTTTEGETSGSSETGESSESTSTGPMPCQGNDDCMDAGAPFCDPAVGACVSCDALTDGNGDGACTEVDTMAPLCVGTECVACTADNTTVCDGQLLVCDDASNACEPCTDHARCESGACNLGDGTCFDPVSVVHVDGDGGQDFTNIVAAVDAMDAGEVGVIVVHELDGAGSYQGALTIDQGKVVALLGAADESPVIQGTGGNPGLRVEGKATAVYLDRIEISLSGAQGLLIDAATVDVRRSRLVQNSGGGIVAQGGSQLYVENCFVGDGTSSEHAIAIDGSAAELLYTTAAVGFDNFDDIYAVSCSNPETVTVRNSLLVSIDDAGAEISCSGATVNTTASETMIPGTANVVLGNVAVDWFFDLDSGDFRLDNPPVALSTAAIWLEGDPLTDINGTPRPTTGGRSDHAGADIP